MYRALASIFGSDKEASLYLSSLGYTGIKVDVNNNTVRERKVTNPMNYIIFQEKDLKIKKTSRIFGEKNELSPELEEILNLFKEAGIEFTTDNEWAKQVVDEANARMAVPYYKDKRKVGKKDLAIIGKNLFSRFGNNSKYGCIAFSDSTLYVCDYFGEKKFGIRDYELI